MRKHNGMTRHDKTGQGIGVDHCMPLPGDQSTLAFSSPSYSTVSLYTSVLALISAYLYFRFKPSFGNQRAVTLRKDMVRRVSCIIPLVTVAVSAREVDGGEGAGSDRWNAYSPEIFISL